jgi:Holliday junction DNA helicase RuvA
VGAIVEVGGVGMLVQCAPGTIATLRVGAPATLHTALVVREDSLTLYGFATADERATFELLQTASGVGPRLAQAILAVHSPDAVRRAVATDDLGALTLVPGIGRKGAQRIVLELKDRLGMPEAPATASTTAVRAQVRDALLSLGYAAREADEAARALPPEADDGDVGLALKAALRGLSR